LIKTIISNCTEEKEIEAFNKQIEIAKKAQIKNGLKVAFTLGMAAFKMCFNYGGGFLTGCYFIYYEVENPTTG